MRQALAVLALHAILLAAPVDAASAPNAPPPAKPYFGPAAGSGGAGVELTLSSSLHAKAALAGIHHGAWEHDIPLLPDPPGRPGIAPRRSEVRTDSARAEAREAPLASTGPIVAFPAIQDTNFIPSDSILAAGQNQIVVAVNASIAIYSKSGTPLSQTFSATNWFKNVLPGLGSAPLNDVFDPQVRFDHFNNRWIMVYLATDQSTQSYILLSVSQTADATGQWWNYSIRGDLNGGTASSNWSDFEGVGFDDHAIYLTTNQFTMAGSSSKFAYSRIRIINKTPLYAGQSIGWFDFWALTDPAAPTAYPFTLRAAVTFGSPGTEYLVSDSPFVTGNYITLWSLTNTQTSQPQIASVNVPVGASTAPPNADQLGGSAGTTNCPAPCYIDVGDRRLLGAVYRNGSLWTTHAVAGGTGNAYARLRYLRIATSSQSVLEDVSFGADGCWYYYPALNVDSGSNLIIVFARSCTNEYAGIRYTGRAAGDTSLGASLPLKAGEANYVDSGTSKTGRNRWGDYFEAAVDPADPTRIWIIGQYAASPANSWGTYVGQVAAAAGLIPACTPDSNTLCLNNGRYKVTAAYTTSNVGSGSGSAVPLTSDTGYFWFFAPTNVEVVIKVLNACVNPYNRYWVFAAGLTNVQVRLTVTDTQTGQVRTYNNPLNTAFQPILDTQAFATCP